MGILNQQAHILQNKEIGTQIFDMLLSFPEGAKAALPGQFISVYLNDPSKLLPRPISICEADASAGTIRLVYRIAGEGTRELSRMKPGEALCVMGPLGNGFSMKKDRAILVGGGIGIPPMLELAKRLQCEKTVVLGYRDELFLKEDFERLLSKDRAVKEKKGINKIQDTGIVIATEDGSFGTKGTVIDAIEQEKVTGEVLYACGPLPMLRALAGYAREAGMEAQISLEERMACGIGACLGCIARSKKTDPHTNVHNKRVCKDGPVFDAREVDFS